MSLIVSFPGARPTTAAEVGGKASSLIRLAEAGLPVPPGAVLTAEFFAPWLDQVQASATWRALADATPDRWPSLCAELKELCPALPLEAAQRQAMLDLRGSLEGLGANALLAVRSSSPEEDLASASFAGGYETRLGVRPADLEHAVRHCFASSLDARVLVYKKEHDLDVLSPRIAVIVQQQIDSEVAGVGFSLNPLTNDYDEAVIDAGWGLGESVVAGLASPDHFIVDKVGRRVLERRLGAKQVSIWLDPGGGTVERKGHRSAELALGDAQLVELTDLMCRIEELYDRPVDVEWAYAGGRLQVLQARPITAYVPLPPEMLTPPGARRRLYVDAALSDGLTINEPISPLGLDWISGFMALAIEGLAGQALADSTPEGALSFPAGGRLYLNLSNAMWLASPKALSRNSAYINALMAEILSNVDASRYRAAARPGWVSLRALGLIPRILWRLRHFFSGALRSILSPERARRRYQRRVDAYERELTESVDFSLPLDDFLRTYTAPLWRQLIDVTMPALIAFVAGLGAIDLVVRKRSPGAEELAEQLKRGFTGNVVVEMGIALFRLARLLDRSDLEDLNGLIERVESRRMPAEFLSAWDAFLSAFGCRGPLEMDLASPRYADDPALALRQMSFMSPDDEGFDPAAAHERQVEARRRAYEELISRSGWLRRALLRRVHRIVDLYAGTRDTPKYHMVLVSYAVRKRVLIEGRRLVREGRLDAAEHVFDVTFGDLESAARDPSLDLREIREERTRFLKQLEAHVTEFPAVIDSRGRIQRPPPRDESADELRGTPVSPGIVTGPVKVLRDPHEKPVDQGDVLVAYTTDPGWTPLFVNAAAVVLEVGGILQHGAVVAREYGKPCVAGIDRLMTRLEDGQTVEVDGTAGVVRLLS